LQQGISFPTTPEPAKNLMGILVVGEIGRAATAACGTPKNPYPLKGNNTKK